MFANRRDILSTEGATKTPSLTFRHRRRWIWYISWAIDRALETQGPESRKRESGAGTVPSIQADLVTSPQPFRVMDVSVWFPRRPRTSTTPAASSWRPRGQDIVESICATCQRGRPRARLDIYIRRNRVFTALGHANRMAFGRRVSSYLGRGSIANDYPAHETPLEQIQSRKEVIWKEHVQCQKQRFCCFR
jgi:hypothetical protein